MSNEEKGSGDPVGGEEIAAPASTKVNMSIASKPPAPALKAPNRRNSFRNPILVV
jgi:hypothetical protein